MIDFVSLPISFWGYALETTCYILNKVPSKSVDITLYEIWTGCKPMLSHLKVWGCPAYIKHLKIDKLGPKSDKYLFVRYPKKIKGYYFYLTEESKVFVSNRTVFVKKRFLEKRTNASTIELAKVYEVEELTHTESNLIEESNPEPVEALLKRFDRVPYQSIRQIL